MKNYMNFYSSRIRFRRSTLWPVLTWVYLFAIYHTAPGQDVKDLYYAQPEGTGLYLGFLYLNEEQFILAGLNELYLFNDQRLLVDTLTFGNKGFLDNLYVLFVENKNKKIINLATLNATMRVQVRDSVFTILSHTLTGKQVKSGREKFDLIVSWKDTYIGREKSDYYGVLNNVNGKWLLERKILPEWPNMQKTYRGSEIIAFNKLLTFGDICFFYDKRYRKLIVFDMQLSKTRVNPMPETTANEFLEFYLDPSTGNTYLFRYNDQKEGTLYKYNYKKNEYYEILKTPHLVRGVYDNKLYVSGTFDNTVAHYLIPIYGVNSEIKLIEDGADQ